MMKKENIVRMINGDLNNNYQSVIQILLEVDLIVEILVLKNQD